MGADISHGRALDECMADNWGGGEQLEGGESVWSSAEPNWRPDPLE